MNGMDTRTQRIAALATVATSTTAAFSILAILERDRRVSKHDRKALNKIGNRPEKHRRAAKSIDGLGKWRAYVPAAIAAGVIVYAKGQSSKRARAAGAIALSIAAAVSALLNPLFDRMLPQPALPPGRKGAPKPTFPSGHASGLGAVALAVAYVLHRERIIGRAAALTIAVVPPIAGGGARLIEEKHWPSEVAGGLLVAVSIACSSLVAYELFRGAEQKLQ